MKTKLKNATDEAAEGHRKFLAANKMIRMKMYEIVEVNDQMSALQAAKSGSDSKVVSERAKAKNALNILQNQNKRIEELEESLQASSGEVQSLTSDSTKKQSRIETLEQELGNARQTIREARNVVSEERKRMEDSEARSRNLEDKVNDLEASMDSKEHIDALYDQLGLKGQSIHSLQSKVSIKQEGINAQAYQLTVKDKAITSLQSQINEKDEAMNDTLTKLERQDQIINDLNRDLAAEENEANSLTAKADNVKGQISDFWSRNQELQATNDEIVGTHTGFKYWTSITRILQQIKVDLQTIRCILPDAHTLVHFTAESTKQGCCRNLILTMIKCKDYIFLRGIECHPHPELRVIHCAPNSNFRFFFARNRQDIVLEICLEDTTLEHWRRRPITDGHKDLRHFMKDLRVRTPEYFTTF